MKLINEDALFNLPASLFYDTLTEYLTKDDKIQKANYYWNKEHPNGKFNPNYLRAYARQFPIADIKNDILSFVVEFARELRSNKDIEKIISYKSPDFGFSTYMHIDFKKPTDVRLSEYISKNESLYTNVKFRFSEHDESSDTDPSKLSAKKVDYFNRTFIDAADEMKKDINDYIEELKYKESEYIKQNQPVESLKLKISESVSLDERLEDISNSTYCTDSAQDIANWIVNKPKPYRVIYDKTYDVWCIADAAVQTHKDMSIDMFDSNYLYDYARDLDADIERMRKEDNLNSGWTDAEAYSDYQFDHYNIKGLIYIPENFEYRDYEESGFYSARTELVNGTIFTTRHSEFSDSGIFKSLYLKLKIMGAIKPDIDVLWKKALLLKHDPDKMLDWFYTVAENHGYTDSQISRFIDDHLTDYIK